MCIVGKLETDEKYMQEAILHEIEVFNGLVPHFNFTAFGQSTQSIQVAEMPIDWYGHEAEIEWN